jgi:hypothetical protein
VSGTSASDGSGDIVREATRIGDEAIGTLVRQ